LRYQPESRLSRWFHERVGEARGRFKRIMIVALARKLMVALWRYLATGIVPEWSAPVSPDIPATGFKRG
jgi:transposase